MTATAQITSLDLPEPTPVEQHPLKTITKRFLKHRLATASLFVMVAMFIISVFASNIAPFKSEELAVGHYFLPFGAVDAKTDRIHYFGTDNIGRDYFSRLVYAGRISLSVALITTFITAVIGVTIGAFSGYYGGWLDALLMRAVEFLATIPALPILLIISAMLIRNENIIPIPDVILYAMSKITLLKPSDARQAVLIIIVLSGLGWLNDARLMRGMVLTLRDQTFVEAARSLGASDLSIIFRHMLPNAMAPIIVNASLNLSGFIVAEAALSFLGFGIQDPIPTWGNMLAATQQFMFDKPWLPLVPGLPIVLASLAFNYIGDGLRDSLDPRLKM
jgi:peptide/nickel transport system permease protein